MSPQSVPKFPREFCQQVDAASKHYKKSTHIGKLPLASLALQAALLENPAHPTDLAGRSDALRQAIQDCLDEMKPEKFAQNPHTVQGEIYLSMFCRFHKRDPITGRAIANVAEYLEGHYQIPEATVKNLRLKKGKAQLRYHLSTMLARQTTWLEPIPQTQDFVGREKELEYYCNQLQMQRLAVIEGLGGVGKTALAARLVESIKSQQPVCWLTIRPGLNDTSRGILYAWAAFLAQNGYPQLWAFMRATANESKPLKEFLPYLQTALAVVQPLLCVDRLELLPEQDKGSKSLLEMLHEEPNSRLLLISRQRPPLTLHDYPLLSGLKPAEVQLFMQQRKIDLTPEQAESVTKHTFGNPRLLQLWTAYMQLQGLDIASSLQKLATSQAAGYFLATEIRAALTLGQQRAADLLSLSHRPLDGYLLQNPPRAKDLLPLTELGIEADDFTALHRLGLIHETLGNQWALSSLLRDHLSSQLMPAEGATDEAIEYHQWLADLYVRQGNVLEAAYHTMQGEETEDALLLLAKYKNLLIEQGHTPAMIALLAPIPANDLSQSSLPVLRELRSTLWELLGDYAAAEAEVKQWENEATTTLAEAKRAQGRLAKKVGNLSEAAKHYGDALQILAIEQATLEAWLHRDQAWILMEQTNVEQAWGEAQRARIALENTLGMIARQRGDFELARHHLNQGATIAREYGERRQLVRINNNLAFLYWQKEQTNISIVAYMSPDDLPENRQLSAENLKRALTIYQENLQIAAEIGEVVGQAIRLLNMGLCYAGLGELNKALTHTQKALPIFTRLGDVKGRILAHLNLAEQYLLAGQLEPAQQHAKAAIDIDKALVPHYLYAEALRIYAEVLLAQGEFKDALTTAHQALEDLRQPNAPDKFSYSFHALLALLTLARIYRAVGNTATAKKYESQAQELEEKLG